MRAARYNEAAERAALAADGSDHCYGAGFAGSYPTDADCGPVVPSSVAGPADALAVLAPLLDSPEAERFAVVALDRRGRVVDAAVMTSGSVSCTVVDTAQIFRWALTRARPVSSILVGHNHPSGDPTPSQEDVTTTRRLVEAGRVIGVRVVDHVILADSGSYSFAAHGAL